MPLAVTIKAKFTKGCLQSASSRASVQQRCGVCSQRNVALASESNVWEILDPGSEGGPQPGKQQAGTRAGAPCA